LKIPVKHSAAYFAASIGARYTWQAIRASVHKGRVTSSVGRILPTAALLLGPNEYSHLELVEGWLRELCELGLLTWETTSTGEVVTLCDHPAFSGVKQITHSLTQDSFRTDTNGLPSNDVELLSIPTATQHDTQGTTSTRPEVDIETEEHPSPLSPLVPSPSPSPLSLPHTPSLSPLTPPSPINPPSDPTPDEQGAHLKKMEADLKTTNRQRKDMPNDQLPIGETAKTIYEVLSTHRIFKDIVKLPGEFANYLADSKAYPNVDVVAEVKKCASYVETSKKVYVDGRALLRNWMSNCQRGGYPRVIPRGNDGVTITKDRFGRETAHHNTELPENHTTEPINPKLQAIAHEAELGFEALRNKITKKKAG